MNKTIDRLLTTTRITALTATTAWVLLSFSSCQQQKANSTWTMFRADKASSSYSALDQVNKDNVSQLKVAWTFNPKDAPEGSRPSRSECNPIVVDGVMYITSALQRVYALNAATGETLWSYDPYQGGKQGQEKRGRGVTYWADGSDKRILGVAGDRLFALNAETGKPIPSFGQNGVTSLNVGMRGDEKEISITPTSPGIVYKNLLILGTEIPDANLYGAEPGYERAFDIRTGKLVWTFHTIPQPGEPGYETWPKDAWKYTGGANDWGGMSLDEKRGLVFLALGSPTYDYYGGNRKGKNLYGNCVVALDANTGKLKWYFQTVHHDLWDYDLPAPPNLVTIERDGKKIDAVAQVSKTGFLYVLDRETGKPLFPVEERKVPASDVPGEEAWPTQPFPTKPAPYSRHTLTEDDLSNYSQADHDSLLATFRSLRFEGIFTPPSLQGTLSLPASTGGSEWGGAAYDPATGVLYVKSNNSPEIGLLKKVEPDNKLNKLSTYDQGKTIYATNCAGCHGADRKGSGPYPSLLGLSGRMTPENVLNLIRHGSGKMPAFGDVIRGHERAIIDFLFEITGKNGQPDLGHEMAHRNAPQLPDSFHGYKNVSAYRQFRDPSGHPGIKPPWGLLNAIDLNTGEYLWKVPVGNIPELQLPGGQPTGMGSMQGPIVTGGGLVFLGGTRDRMFRAFDKATGKLLWETELPAAGSSNPCTYFYKGKQYISLSVGGTRENPSGSLVTFALPD